ncbi:MAG: hypothetical protein IPK04_15075 [Bdellovibrionales bacterium]|nr:hypothetical protein [Bdellovibrionales bacterium]
MSISENRIFNLEKWRADELDSSAPPKSVKIFTTNDDSLKLAASGETDSLDREPVSAMKTAELQKLGWGAVPSEITSETFVILIRPISPWRPGAIYLA